MAIKLETEGFKELEKALGQMKRGTSKGVARRAMRKSLKPIQDMAEGFWPGANKAFMTTSRRPKRSGGHPRGDAVLNMFVGSFEPHAHLLEFGTGPRYHKSGKYVGYMTPMPMLQPAWDANQGEMLDTLREILGQEIAKTFARLAAKG